MKRRSRIPGANVHIQANSEPRKKPPTCPVPGSPDYPKLEVTSPNGTDRFEQVREALTEVEATDKHEPEWPGLRLTRLGWTEPVHVK
jgi:hypothetical protein